MAYSAAMTDELDVREGDTVLVQVQYYDGWCFGMNLNTNRSGALPVASLCPLTLSKMHIFSVCDLTADAMGYEIIQGVQLAYPSLVKVDKFNSITLTPDKVNQTLEGDGRDAMVVVCGPTGMTSRVVDMMEEFGNGWNLNIKILNSDSPY